MALKQGATAEIIAENAEGLVRVGYTQDRANAIAESAAHEWRAAQDEADARRTANRTHGVAMRDRAAFYTTEQLGKTRYLTPEGFLVIVGVPIARTGEQVYSESELNEPGDLKIRGDIDGVVIVKRVPEEVFRPESLASGEGKPIVIEHPTEFVTPATHKMLSVGHAQNLRRGEGIEDDVVLADYVITDPMAIDYVNREKPQISLGYRADYDQDVPGSAYQRNIVINHHALVKYGRAGARISVGDSLPSPGDTRMKLRDVVKLFLPNLATNDNAAVTAALDSDVAGIAPATVVQQPTADSAVLAEIKKLGERIDTIDSKVASIAKRTADEEAEAEAARKKKDDEEAEKKAKESKDGDIEKMEATDTILEAESPGSVLNLGQVYTGDSAGGKVDALKQIASRAEILAPGTAIPTTDSLKGSKGVALATFMRQVLEKCATTDAGKEALSAFLMNRKVTDLKGHALLGVFNGAANLVAARNNSAAQRMGVAKKTTDFGTAPKTNAEINVANRAFWDKQRAAR